MIRRRIKEVLLQGVYWRFCDFGGVIGVFGVVGVALFISFGLGDVLPPLFFSLS
jgi:hypothetical protein